MRFDPMWLIRRRYQTIPRSGIDLLGSLITSCSLPDRLLSKVLVASFLLGPSRILIDMGWLYFHVAGWLLEVGVKLGPHEPSRLCRGAPLPLYKQNSWSPDILRDEVWTNRWKNHRIRCGRSVTDDDLNEIRGCLDLGFKFDSSDLDPKL
ncbi:hypothetical protein ACS0TY_016388 [Phlomoides rotata]